MAPNIVLRRDGTFPVARASVLVGRRVRQQEGPYVVIGVPWRACPVPRAHGQDLIAALETLLLAQLAAVRFAAVTKPRRHVGTMMSDSVAAARHAEPRATTLLVRAHLGILGPEIDAVGRLRRQVVATESSSATWDAHPRPDGAASLAAVRAPSLTATNQRLSSVGGMTLAGGMPLRQVPPPAGNRRLDSRSAPRGRSVRLHHVGLHRFARAASPDAGPIRHKRKARSAL